MSPLSISQNVTNSVSKREEFNEKINIFSSMQNISYFSYNKEIEKNLKFMTKAGHGSGAKEWSCCGKLPKNKQNRFA